MSESFEIKGGADEFEAAVVAVVLDHLRHEKKARHMRSNDSDSRLPGWIRAIAPDRYGSLDPSDGPV